MSTSTASSFNGSHDEHDVPASPTEFDSSILSEGNSILSQDATGDDPRDMEKHPKGRRKRTAAKDKMILEDAYNNNPKPDKQARLDIVNRVSLNEKEVQIWFQNRRQNDRRKSRPLSPQELAALRFNGVNGISSTPINSYSLYDGENSHASSYSALPSSYSRGPAPHSADSPDLSQSPPPTATPGAAPLNHSSSEITPQNREASSQESNGSSPILSQSFSSSIGYLANRWNIGTSFSTPASLKRSADESFGFEPLSASARSEGTPCLKRSQSQSQIRLALSLEGKAELISNELSPVKDSPRRPASTLPSMSRGRMLQRSYSALPTVTLPPISTLTNLLPPRLAHGRSRNVQAWESCADADKRDELAAQAENESNGSAIAAISLLRSTSGVLQSSSSRRNTPVGKSQQQHNHASQPFKKPRISRTNSSMGCLEHTGKENELDADKLAGKVKVSALLMSPTDSDKENLSPDEDGNARDRGVRRPLPSTVKSQNARRLGRVLQTANSPRLLSRANTAPMRKAGGDSIEIYDDSAERPPSRAEDVEKFMRGQVSPSKKGDMDCVAGLLSLSQGAWR